MIDIDIQRELRYELIENEKLLWTGRPQTGLIFRKTDIFLIPFSLFWCGIVLIAVFSIGTSDAPFPVFLFFIPFLVMGCYVTFGRFIIDSRRRANTIYGITDNRIIIRSGIFSKRVNSLNIRTLSDISIEEKSDGSGDILLGPNNYIFGMMTGMMWQGGGGRFSSRLESIADVKSVYSLILKLQRN